jgi:hypothetical protein
MKKSLISMVMTFHSNLVKKNNLISSLKVINRYKALVINLDIRGLNKFRIRFCTDTFNDDIKLFFCSEQVNKLMDQDMNQPIFDELEEKHIEYRLNEEITDINGI